MPGDLPASSAYTYAAEISADEVAEAGASGVEFSEPLPFYFDNFLNYPVGTAVPLGAYNRDTARWEAQPNGRVIKIVSGGIDTDDDGQADNSGMSDEEVSALQNRYSVGKTLWRVELTFFAVIDCNSPGGYPTDAIPPNGGPPSGNDTHDQLDASALPACREWRWHVDPARRRGDLRASFRGRNGERKRVRRFRSR